MMKDEYSKNYVFDTTYIIMSSLLFSENQYNIKCQCQNDSLQYILKINTYLPITCVNSYTCKAILIHIFETFVTTKGLCL